MLFTRLRSSMKAVVILVSLAFVASLFYMGFSQRSKNVNVADAVAKVNGKAISREEFLQNFNSYAQYQEQNQGPITGDQMLSVKANILDQMVDHQLLVQAAKEAKTKVDKKAVEKEFDRIKNQFPTKEAFKQALLQNNLTEKALRDTLKQNKVLEAFQADKRKEFKASKADLVKAYEEVKASHILIKVDDKVKDAEAKAKAEKVLAEVNAGGDFTKLAATYSDDTSNKASGGDLGFFGRGRMVKPFEDAVFGMKVGEVSGLVKSEFGYHIIKVTDRKAAKGKAFEKAKKDLKKQVAEDKYNKWFASYKKAADVSIVDHEVNAYKLDGEGKLDKALAEYEQAAQVDPSNAYIYVNEARIFVKKKDQTNALKMFQKAAEVNESDANIRLYLGNSYKENKQIDKAVVEFKKASDLAPMDFYLHFNLLTVFQQMGKKEEVKGEEAKLKKIYEAMEAQRKAQEEQQKQLAEQQKAAEDAAKAQDKATTTDKK